jgi:hypothetical protein
MTAFDDRLKAELSKFQHDMELEFRVRLRRNKLFALRVAKELGLEDRDALDYAKAVVLADFSQVGDDPVLQKVIEDLRAKGAEVDAIGLQRDLDKMKQQAQQQVMQE